MPTTARTTRRRLPPEKRRAEIVSTAMNVISQRGYRGLTLKEVADACGMTAPGLMHYFPTTAELLHAVLDYYTVILRRRTTMLMRTDGLNARAALDEVVKEIWRWPVCIRLYLHLSAEAVDHEHPAHSYILARHRRAIESLSEVIGDEHPDAAWASQVFYLIIDGIRMHWVRSPEIDPFAEWTRIANAVYAGTPLATPDQMESLPSDS